MVVSSLRSSSPSAAAGVILAYFFHVCEFGSVRCNGWCGIALLLSDGVWAVNLLSLEPIRMFGYSSLLCPRKDVPLLSLVLIKFLTILVKK